MSYRPAMPKCCRKILGIAAASLLEWGERDPDTLRKLLESWYYRPLLTDVEAERVVRFVANRPL